MSNLPDVADASADYGMPDTTGFANYLAEVTDPTTDWDAAKASAMIADTAGMTHTARRCWARFSAGASPALQATNGHDAVWGNASGVKPTLAHTPTGIWTATWPTSVTDSLGASHNVNLRWAKVSVEGSTVGIVQCAVTASNVVTIYGFNTSFAANDLTGLTIFVEAG